MAAVDRSAPHLCMVVVTPTGDWCSDDDPENARAGAAQLLREAADHHGCYEPTAEFSVAGTVVATGLRLRDLYRQ